MNKVIDDKPWYRQLWPWLIMVPPAAAVIAGISTVVIANTGADSLVVDDYQKIGLVASRVNSRDRAAERLGVGASIAMDARSGDVTVRLSHDGEKMPDALLLKLHHPTQPELDRRAMLKPDSSGLFRGEIGSSNNERWYLELQDLNGTWRLTRQLQADQQLVEFEPASD